MTVLPIADAQEFRTVTFCQTNYGTGCVTREEVDAPIVARHRDHDVVQMPDGSRRPVRKVA